jgi:hypothetical protein
MSTDDNTLPLFNTPLAPMKEPTGKTARRRVAFVNEQEAELSRVSSRIAASIVTFCRQRLANDPVFNMNELLDYTMAAFQGVAPASPDRVLRDLRSKGVVRVDCISRSQSLYRIHEVPHA